MLGLKTIKKFASDSGYSEKAIRHKIYGGVWGDGIKYKAPDGRVLISTEGFEKWVQGITNENIRTEKELSQSATQQSESDSLGERLRLLRMGMIGVKK